MYFYFILNHDYEQMEEKVTADTGEIEGMSIGQESMCVLGKDRCVNVETEMDGNISNQPGKKRKHDDVFEMNNESDDAEVSTPQKKVCTSSSSTAPVEHDHTYCIGSPRKLRRKLDDVIDHAQRVNKRLKKSWMKASRLKKKVDSLTSVVSALKKETTFSAVPKELTLDEKSNLHKVCLVQTCCKYQPCQGLHPLRKWWLPSLHILCKLGNHHLRNGPITL